MHTPKPTPEVGQWLGDYQLLAIIGEGGYGRVYRAQHGKLQREVAIKCIMARENDPLSSQRFLREVDLIRRLEDPNIVRLYDFGVEGERLLWMAMELVRGQSLAQVIAERGPLPPPMVKHIILQVLSALISAHQKGIIHRDLKPANLMLTVAGADTCHVKVLDFGIGKAINAEEDPALQDLTQAQSTNVSHGTPRYMAPEQIFNESPGPATDIYAVGLLAYELMCGRSPFTGVNTMEILAHRFAHPIDFPPAILANPPLHRLLVQALDDKPSQRPDSAETFHQALSAIDFVAAPAAPKAAVPPQTPELAIGADDAALSAFWEQVAAVEPDAAPPVLSSVQQVERPRPDASLGAEITSASPQAGPGTPPTPAPRAGQATRPQTNVPTPALELADPRRSPNPALRPPPVAPLPRPVEATPSRRRQIALIALLLILGAAIVALVLSRGGDGTPETPAAEAPAPPSPVAAETALAETNPDEACDPSTPDGCLALALQLANARDEHRDDSRAAALFLRTCDAGLAEACGNYAALQAEGRGVDYDPQAAARRFQDACERDHAMSCYNLGAILYDGRGVAADTKQALFYFTEACRRGLERGCEARRALRQR